MNSTQTHYPAAQGSRPRRENASSPPCGTDVQAAILDHLSVPIMLVNQDATIIYANRAAKCASAAFPTRDEHVVATPSRTDAARLRLAISKVCESRTAVAIVMGEAGADPVVAVISPFAGALAHDDCALVLMRGFSGISEALPGVLRELFQLSSAETQIAIAIGRGTDINEVARGRGVKRNTLRSQLASIMERTGTHRQAELAALIGRIDAIV